MATTNINLEEIALSQTFGQWLDAFNGNMGAIDALPIPMEYGKNTTMEYLKFTNGKVIMWGRVDYGTNYICTDTWADHYASKDFTLNFPIALTNSNPVVIPHVMTGSGYNPDIWCVTRSTSYTTYTGVFVSAFVDSTVKVPKVLNILVIGDWK